LLNRKHQDGRRKLRRPFNGSIWKGKNMSFRQKHQPASIKDLVFRDPRVGQIIADYAAGIRTKHLLLEGPTSSGKSEAARLILKERLFASMGPAYSSIYHGQGFTAATLKQLEGDWNKQMAYAGTACSLIDEVDFAGTAGCREIQKFIDSKSYGTLICTTNNLHKLEDPFVSRFYVVKVDPPLPADWHTRALQILQSEGHAVTMSTVQNLFANFNGHARDFMDLVEDAHIKSRSKQQASLASAFTIQPALSKPKSAVPSVTVPKGLHAKIKVTASASGGKSKP
jgi:replication factor C subunit 3/5